nr:myosin heavy chain-related protein [Tanacetum cinerariifolium]
MTSGGSDPEAEYALSKLLQIASLDANGSLYDNEEIKKDHTRVHELEKQVEKLPMELQLKNNFREALETKDLEKKMFDLNPTVGILDLMRQVNKRMKKRT